jgi:hypothetical protein
VRFFLEIGLWVVALNSLVLLFVVARRSLRAQAGYAILLAANLALSAGLLVTSNVDSPLAFVSIGAFVFMVLLPPIVDRAAHRAVTAERMKLALTLSAIRELLQPGAEARQLRRALNRLARVRGGEADEVIAELSEKIGSAEGPARLGLQMQKLSVILYARRWSQAIEYFEDNLPFEITAFNPTLAAGLIRAYGETGRLDRMAHVSASLEDSPGVSQVAASEPLAQARMIFLAFCGRHDALLRLLEERSGFAQSVEPEMREVWIGIAFKMDGRKKEARAHLERAHRRLKGPSARRELKRHLDTLDELEPPVDELSDEGLQLQAEKVLERAPPARGQAIQDSAGDCGAGDSQRHHLVGARARGLRLRRPGDADRGRSEPQACGQGRGLLPARLLALPACPHRPSGAQHARVGHTGEACRAARRLGAFLFGLRSFGRGRQRCQPSVR